MRKTIDYILITIAILMCFFCMLDYVLTYYGTQKFGLQHEGNIITKTLIEDKGYSAWFGYKLIALIISCLIVLFLFKLDDLKIFPTITFILKGIWIYFFAYWFYLFLDCSTDC